MLLCLFASLFVLCWFLCLFTPVCLLVCLFFICVCALCLYVCLFVCLSAGLFGCLLVWQLCVVAGSFLCVFVSWFECLFVCFFCLVYVSTLCIYRGRRISSSLLVSCVSASLQHALLLLFMPFILHMLLWSLGVVTAAVVNDVVAHAVGVGVLLVVHAACVVHFESYHCR